MQIPKPHRQERISSPLKRSGKLKPIGRKGREWNEAKARIRPRLLALGVTRCEFGFVQCTGGTNITMAHAVKRRFIQRNAEFGTPEHIETIALACMNCHRKLDEQMSHAEMQSAVLAAIARRA